jgi:hypothetical protein
MRRHVPTGKLERRCKSILCQEHHVIILVLELTNLHILSREQELVCIAEQETHT